MRVRARLLARLEPLACLGQEAALTRFQAQDVRAMLLGPRAQPAGLRNGATCGPCAEPHAQVGPLCAPAGVQCEKIPPAV